MDNSPTRDLIRELEDRVIRLREWFDVASSYGAEVWRYHTSYQMLGLRAQNHETRQILYILCGGCHFIESPAEWHHTKFEIALSNDTESKFRFWDTSARFCVECQAVDFGTEKGSFFEKVDVMRLPENWSAKQVDDFKKSDSRFLEEMEHRHIDIDSSFSSPQDITSFLAEWMSRFEFMRAEVWKYCHTSRLLELRLQPVGAKQSLHIVCEGCHYFQTKTWMYDAKIDLFFSSLDPSRWVIRDTQAGLTVECEIVKISINVPPLFLISE